MTWNEGLDISLKVIQVLSTIIGVLVVYFKIARKIGQWEAIQSQTTKTVDESKTEQKEMRTELVGLSKLVHELFGQLKKTTTRR